MIRVAMLCSHPARHVTAQKFYGTRATHVSSWNVTLVEALSRIEDLDLTVIIGGPLFRTQVIRRGRVTFVLAGHLPKIEQYVPQIRLLRTRLFLHKIRPDVVHGIGNEHMYPWIALHSGFPHIVTYHGILYERWKQPNLSQRIRLRLEDEVFRHAQNAIIISPSVEKLIYSGRPPGSPRRFSIPNPIAREFFEYRSGPRDADLAMVGMIYPVKNTHLLIPVVERLRAGGINIKAKVIGDPVHSHQAYAKDISREIEARGLTENIQFCGQIENRLLPAELGRCRILLHLSEFETSPMVIREAMALGVVPVARPVGGIPDMIQHNVNGILLDVPDFITEASRQIQELLDCPSEMQRLSQAARQNVQGTCDPDLVAAKHFEAYRQVSSC
jgi:glycosyltransferase involved in cell wall biosynthesis